MTSLLTRHLTFVGFAVWNFFLRCLTVAIIRMLKICWSTSCIPGLACRVTLETMWDLSVMLLSRMTKNSAHAVRAGYQYSRDIELVNAHLLTFAICVYTEFYIIKQREWMRHFPCAPIISGLWSSRCNKRRCCMHSQHEKWRISLRVVAIFIKDWCLVSSTHSVWVVTLF